MKDNTEISCESNRIIEAKMAFHVRSVCAGINHTSKL